MENKEFEIWTEGYRATGESSDATFHGKVKAADFVSACQELFKGSKDFYVQNGVPKLWGCGCFDNEVDARKSFG